MSAAAHLLWQPKISWHCQKSSGGRIPQAEKHGTREMRYLCRRGQCHGTPAPRRTQLSVGLGKGSQSPGPCSPWDTLKIPFWVDAGKGFYSWGSDKVLFQKPYSASFIVSVPSFIFKLSEGRVYPFWFNFYQNTFTQAGTKYYILILKSSAETVRIKLFFLQM